MNNTYINIEIKLYPRNESKEKEINSLKTFSEKYDAIINYYRNIDIDKNVYCENHHINPKSISNDDSVENIVRVPGVIHYILHCLLPYKYKEENNEIGYFKMMNAWSRISNSSQKKKNIFNIYDDGLKYHKLKEEYAKYVSEYRIKYGIAKGEKNGRYGKEVSEETREKLREKILKNYKDPEIRQHYINGQTKRYSRQEEREKSRINRLGKKMTKEQCQNISNGIKLAYSKHPEYREKCARHGELNGSHKLKLLGKSPLKDKIAIKNLETHKSKYINKNDPIPLGWIRGRFRRKIKEVQQ